MDSAASLQLVTERGWRSGLGNLLRRDLRVWWGSRFGLVQAIIWLVALNGIWAIILVSDAPTDFESYFAMAFIFPCVGVVVLAQGAIVGERRSGTAAWILSGPVSRRAFLFSKLIPLASGSLGLMVVLPGMVALIEFTAITGESVHLGRFLSGLVILWLYLLFFLSLTIMAGAFFRSRGAVMGVAFGVLAGGMIPTHLVPWQLHAVMPWAVGWLPSAVVEGYPLVINGHTIATPLPLITTAVWCAVFVVVGVWRFQREDF